ncbi:MAG: N-acetylmuramoyl-L-alanine amidase [Dehalococcoidia bacterium]|nr:N-acetylmuramoyl-L-alanine amidase [Dehalococcoidia bacterium]
MTRSFSRRALLKATGGAAALGMAWRGLAPQQAYANSDPSLPREWVEMARWIDTEVLPVPDGMPAPLPPGGGQNQAFWEAFRAPFPPTPVWNPPGRFRVGVQAGHWLYYEAPQEQAQLRLNPGTSGGGRAEWEVTLDLSRRMVAMLEEEGVQADLLPTTVPIRYRAHVFISIHCDGDVTGTLRGYKVSNSSFSSTPEADQVLLRHLWDEYGAATNFVRQPNQISRRMTGYYAFNARRYQHAIAPGVPHAIFETAFLTNAQDRAYLFNEPDRLARGIVRGIMGYLNSLRA